jgi:hypothetical protein
MPLILMIAEPQVLNTLYVNPGEFHISTGNFRIYFSSLSFGGWTLYSPTPIGLVWLLMG